MKLERENKIDWRHAVYSELPEDIKHKLIWGMGDYEGIMNDIGELCVPSMTMSDLDSFFNRLLGDQSSFTTLGQQILRRLSA
jgi:hypothetical protein